METNSKHWWDGFYDPIGIPEDKRKEIKELQKQLTSLVGEVSSIKRKIKKIREDSCDHSDYTVGYHPHGNNDEYRTCKKCRMTWNQDKDPG